MIGTVQDVTAFREAEKEGRLGADVFRHTSDAIVVLDTDYKVVDANPAFSRLLERDPETILGCAVDQLLSFEGEGSEWRTKIDAEGGWRGEAVCRPDSTASLPVYVTLNAVRDVHDRLLSYVAICRDISAEKANQQQLWHVANHDSLTGLPNRSLFMDRVQQAERIARRNQSQFALLLLDLDGFKQVNDSRGHAVGDALLGGVAARLTELVRDSDTVARLAGDEFTVLLTDVRERDALAGFVSQLIARVSDPYLIENEPTTITVSAGVALYPEDADSASSLLRNADQAMYAAKRAGKNRFSFCTGPASD
jgi:diguanylate cyclase (GGDEF)-like protein/PAS domain S-box-containing protein